MTSEGSSAGRGVGVFPEDTIVLLMTADDVLDDNALTCRIDFGTIKILKSALIKVKLTFIVPKQSQPFSKLLAARPSPISPKSKTGAISHEISLS